MNEHDLRQVLTMAGAKEVKPSGDRYLMANCLFPWEHKNQQDTRPSMSVSIDAGGPSWVRCFGCGYHRPLSVAIRDLARKMPVYGFQELADWVEKCEGSLVPVPGEARTPEKRLERVLDYTEQALSLRNVPLPGRAQAFLATKGVPPDFAAEQVLWEPKKRCLVFPVLAWREDKLRVIGAGARKPRAPTNRETKYWTIWEFDAGLHLYGEHLLPQWKGMNVLAVEGYMDALHCWWLRKPCVALIGKSFGPERAKMLHRWGIRSVCLAFDPDVYEAAGWEKRVNRILASLESEGVRAYYVIPEKDPKYLDKETLSAFLKGAP